MTESLVRIARLEPMRVASFHAFSASPEGEAWQKLIDWAEPFGLLREPKSHRIFGFNSPSPSAGSPNYGYEFWIQAPDDFEGGAVEDSIAYKKFEGGLYAVAHFQGGGEAIPESWKRLSIWCESSPYRMATHQWLEEHLGSADSPQLELDLYLPITK